MPKPKKIIYKKNFLTNVICRIDFAPIAEHALKQNADNFTAKVSGVFPKREVNNLVEYKATVNKAQMIDERKEYPIYIFFDENKTKKISLTFNHISIEFFKYQHFTEFDTITKKVIASFIELYKPSKYNRLGLRYINQIRLETGNPFEWGRHIDSSLTYVVNKFLDNKEDVSRAMSQVVINHDDYKVNFTYGFINSEFPAKIRRKEFILDFDFFTQDFNESNVFDCIERFNDEADGLFEKSIKDGLREIMEVE
ncbi:MAG: TIGR04255 family protein [Candidatus Omnitrophica bacterium]|nr:TIGR04255 family protein [Candidatus Omnitrophota bacterium]